MSEKLIVTARNLNLRNEGSLDSDVIAILGRGTVVDAIELSTDGVWQNVSHSGVKGWASFKFLQPVMEGVFVSPFGWFDIAQRELGEIERPGSSANPRIIQYLQSTNLPAPMAATDETPWCSAFVNFCVEEAGFEGTNSAGARSWLKWGKETDVPIVGCIAVFERGPLPSGHVAFFVSDEGKKVRVLGGNQGNAVTMREFPKKAPGGDLLSYRVPS